MRSGRLNKRVAIQTATETRGTTGQVLRTWATDITVWAAVEPIKADERIANQAVQGATTHRVYLRYGAYPNLTSKCRFLYRDRIFEIRGVVNMFEGGREWVCDCREILT